MRGGSGDEGDGEEVVGGGRRRGEGAMEVTTTVIVGKERKGEIVQGNEPKTSPWLVAVVVSLSMMAVGGAFVVGVIAGA